ncbi:MAG TPA: hypothetical protein VKY74_18425, partial [Chloroflexia bacterium]|nr:hypothetical protein [Chloroflexia bacterium]
LAHGQAWLVQTAVDPPTGALSITRQIVLGPDLYTQAGANWTRSAGGPARLAAVLTSLHGLLPNGGAGYVPAGQEMVAGSLANIYSYPLPGATLVPSGASAPSWDVYGYPGPTTTPRPVTRVASYWVDSADGLLRRLSVAGRAGPQTTTDYLEIGAVNQPVTIARPGSAPTPVPTPAADCHPGWSVAPGADAGPLYAITSRGPADAWAVGASATRPQTALIQRWDGARWQTLPAPNAGPGDNRLAAVVATGPADAWAAGSYTNGPAGRRALLVHWDGTVWSRVPEPGDLPTDPQTVSDTDPQTVSELLGLAATGPDDVWAVGTIHPANYSGRESLILHWDGRQWRRVASPPAGALQAVAAAGPQSAWAAGESLLHWDGTRWEGIADLPAAADTARTFTSLVLEGPDDLWALGMRGGAATYLDEQDSERPSLDQTVAQMAHWDGQRWQLLPEVDPLGCRCLRIWGGAASGPDDLWAIGTGVLRWNGQGWQAIAPPRSSGLPPYISLGPWRAAAAAGPGSFWMVGTMHTDQAAQPGPFAFRYTAGPCPAGP